MSFRKRYADSLDQRHLLDQPCPMSVPLLYDLSVSLVDRFRVRVDS